MTIPRAIPNWHDLPLPTYHVPRLPPRAPAAHKGTSGRVAIVGGSVGMSGAVVLSALGALRAGTGLVRASCPKSILPIVANGEFSLMTEPLPETDAGCLSDTAWNELQRDTLAWASVVAVGPGLRQAEETRALLDQILRDAPQPLVLDADGLNLAGAAPATLVERQHETILTPHPGEMSRLLAAVGLDALDQPLEDPALHAAWDQLGQAHEQAALAVAFPTGHRAYDLPRLRAAVGLARATNAVVLLKGFRTVVADSSQAFINTTGNPGMATGGMGDVLTGAIAALRAQRLTAFQAACLGAHIHGLAADYCADRVGDRGYLAREVADLLPSAIHNASRAPIGFRQ